MKEEILEELGFSKNEAKVYLALLETGLATAGEISEKSNVHRTNVYDAIKRLVERGLASYIEKKEIMYYEAADPENLMNLLKEKESKLQVILPQLKLSKNLAQSKGEAHIFEGAEAFMQILYGFLNYKEQIFVYGIPKDAPEMLKTVIPHFHNERIKRKIQMNSIYNYDAQDRIKYYKSLPYSDARYVDDKFKSLVSTNICGDEVVLSLWIKPVLIIQIKNKEIAKAYKHYFEILWENAV